MTVSIRPASDTDYLEVKRLLEFENLPVEDLSSALRGFFVACSAGQVIGVAGVDSLGQVGLFRSLVVKAEFRNRGIASQLTKAAVGSAWQSGLKEIYSLTVDAMEFLEKEGFEEVPREQAPREVLESAQFRSLCSQSARLFLLEASASGPASGCGA